MTHQPIPTPKLFMYSLFTCDLLLLLMTDLLTFLSCMTSNLAHLTCIVF